MSSDRDQTVLSLSSSTRIPRSFLGIRLIEGSFSVTSKLTSFSLYVKFQYGEQVWKSCTSLKAGCKPKWNTFHQFDLSPCQAIDITVYDKSILFSDSEIGHSKLILSEISQGHQTEWWSISNANQVVGRVLLTFDLPQEEQNLFSLHSSHNSLEIREEYFKQLKSDPDDDLMVQLANYRREKSRNKSTVQDDNIEKIKSDLAQENSRLRDKDSGLRILFEQAKRENAKLKKAKAEIKRCKENLKRREQSLIVEEVNLQQEKSKLVKEKEEIQAMKSQLSHDSAKLKQEKQKLSNEKREIESLTKELGQASKRIHKEKIMIKKSSLTTRPFFEEDPFASQTGINSSESVQKLKIGLKKTQNSQSEYLTF